jgi:CheY-like chemotaxis protein
VFPAPTGKRAQVATILIVEPHVDIRSLLELVVRRLGHEAVVYDGGDIADLHVDAAVIEPGEGLGILLARRARALGLPVLFASIFPADGDALALEPAAYLVKPFPLYMLENALAGALGASVHAAAV